MDEYQKQLFHADSMMRETGETRYIYITQPTPTEEQNAGWSAGQLVVLAAASGTGALLMAGACFYYGKKFWAFAKGRFFLRRTAHGSDLRRTYVQSPLSPADVVLLTKTTRTREGKTDVEAVKGLAGLCNQQIHEVTSTNQTSSEEKGDGKAETAIEMEAVGQGEVPGNGTEGATVGQRETQDHASGEHEDGYMMGCSVM